MWKYVSRRIKDTFERGAGYFDARGAASAGASAGVSRAETPAPERRTGVPCRFLRERRCWGGRSRGDGANSNSWYFIYLNQSWIGALTWSSALALGWYATQLMQLKKKCHRQKREHASLYSVMQRNLSAGQLFSVKPVVAVSDDQYTVKKGSLLEKFENGEAERFMRGPRDSSLEYVNNEHSSESAAASNSSTSTNDLSDILNSIENRLGLAAIENGQHKDGLSMLRSAANRHHPPALYNLGLCYELGLGVKPDEKMAMELYRIAATLEHPGALYNLAIYYGQGRGGLPRDMDTATRLLRLAAIKGQADAISALKTLEPEVKQEETWVNPDEPKLEDPWLKPEHWVSYDERINLVPPQTSLFVEQIQAFRGKHLRCEAAVY